MSKEQAHFEELLAYHCAPTLKKYKPANMFHVSKDTFNDIDFLICQYNEYLKEKGLLLRLFQADSFRITVYVYDPSKIQKILKDQKVQVFLNQFGYPDCPLEKCFQHLDKRITFSKTYPHEIGIFLGYPLDDVLGFLNKEHCLYAQDWCVYTDLATTKKLFSKFRSARKQFIEGIESGKTILQLV